MTEVLKQMYQLLLTEPHAPTLCERLERIAREAIAELESQEPVAWLVEFENGEQELHFDKLSVGETQTPLYTHPPQRTWVGNGDLEDSNAYLNTEDKNT
jgi:hypothetical protein